MSGVAGLTSKVPCEEMRRTRKQDECGRQTLDSQCAASNYLPMRQI